MKKYFNLFAVLLLLVGTMAPSFIYAQSNNNGFEVCHCQGNECETLSLSFRGARGHLRNHNNDYWGACEEQETDATVVAHKIICNDESLLPNWGANGGANITSTTAQTFVTNSQGNCWFAPNRSFQWGNDNVTNPGDTYYGAAGDGWNTFGVTDANGMTTVDIPVGDNDHLWIREVLQDGYIPFTYGPYTGNSNNVSAEVYCSTDVINYDNFDKIDAPVAGDTYYCVAFNVAIPPVCGDDVVNQKDEQCDGTDNCTDECLCAEGYEPSSGEFEGCVPVEPDPACGDGNVDRYNYETKIAQIDDIQIPLGEECDDGNTTDGDGCSANCTIEYICEFEENTGWYGQYYNYLSTHPDMNLPQNQWNLSNVHGDPESNVTPWNTDWYDNTYYRFAQVDANLEFGPSFFPFDGAPEELSSNNHEHHFGVHWSAQTYITNTGSYDFTMTTDDDIWVYVDGVLVDETDGIHPATVNAFSVALNPGTHIFDIYYADRHTVATHMFFTSLDDLVFVPYNENCNEEDPVCGNQLVESGEACDDGNEVSGDGCEIDCTASVCNPRADIVYNGGFEEPALDAGTWSIIPNVAGGWTVEVAGTDTPDGLEIQNSLWTPYEGVQYAELDGNLSTEISQTLTTIPGQNYSLNFVLSARPGVDVSSNGIEVYWNGVLVAPIIVLDGSANSDTSWSTYSYNVLATTSSSTLLIKDGGVSDSLGMFVDDVSVYCSMQGGDGDGDDDPYCGDGIINGNEECDGGTNCPGSQEDGMCQCEEGYQADGNNGCELIEEVCEVPEVLSEEALAFCDHLLVRYDVFKLVAQEMDSVLLSDYDQCIYEFYCEEECFDTSSATFDVIADTHSIGSPLTTSFTVEVGDVITITADSTDTWSAGADDRTSNAAGLIDGNPYGGNYGDYVTMDGSFPYGALVGRIFGGSYFFVGTSATITATEAGALQLLYWDSVYDDNTDSILATVEVESRVFCMDAYCGDGVVNQEIEECDDGNDINGDSCKNSCELPNGGGGSSCTINCDGDDTPDELLRTGGDGDGDGDEDRDEEPKDEPRTSTPLTFGPQSSIALQLPAMLAATGATVQSTSMWMVLFVISCLGLAAVASSSVISKK